MRYKGMENITNVINNLSQLDYKSLNAQECIELMTEVKRLDDIIKQKLAKVLVNKSQMFSLSDKVYSYSIVSTPQGNKVFEVCWKTQTNWGESEWYDIVTIEEFNSIDLNEQKSALELINILNNR